MIPPLPARLIEVLMSWNFLPVKASLPSGSTVSSATCRLGQPNPSVTSFTASVVLYRHGVQFSALQNATNSSIVRARSSGGPTGSPVVIATPPSTR